MEGSQKVTIPTLMSLLPADAVSLFFRPSVCNNNNSDSFPSNAWGKRENFAFCGPFAHCTVIVRKYCCTVWPEPIWIKVSGWWQIPPQHQSAYLGGPESASIEIPSFRPHFIKNSFWKFYEARAGEISIHADSGPPRFVFWCCSGICHQPDTFIQIGFGHTVYSH